MNANLPRSASSKQRAFDRFWRALSADAALAAIRTEKTVTPDGLPTLAFDPAADLVFDYGPPLSGHANGMVLTARDAQGEERERLWALMTEVWPYYDDYQARTERQIPVVVLERR